MSVYATFVLSPFADATDTVDSATSTGTGSLKFCDSFAGRWDLTATIIYTDDDAGAGATTSTEYLSSSFKMRPIKTRTRLALSTRSPSFNQVVTFTIFVDEETRKSYEPAKHSDVVLEIRLHGSNRWTKVRESSLVQAGSHGLDLVYRWNTHKTAEVRARTIAFSHGTKGSASRPVTIRAR